MHGVPADGCTRGDASQLSRTFRMRVQVGRDERDATLTVEILKKKIDEKTSAWFLSGLREQP